MPANYNETLGNKILDESWLKSETKDGGKVTVVSPPLEIEPMGRPGYRLDESILLDREEKSGYARKRT